MGKKLQNIVEYAISNKYLTVSKNIIGDLTNINDENVVILTSNERGKPYSVINKIVNGDIKEYKLSNVIDDAKNIAYPNEEDINKTYSYIFILNKR